MSSQSTDRAVAGRRGDAGTSALYTGTGDRGETALGEGTRTSKTDPRIDVRGECQEASALLGMAITLAGDLSDELVLLLTRVENDLIDIGADIVNPPESTDTDPRMRLDDGYVTRLEQACGHFGDQLSEPSTVVLPGGTTSASVLHHAYTVVRRAERTACVALENDEQLNPVIAKYLNRLGSLLHILARVANAEHGDIEWHPGMTTELGETGLWEPIPEPDESES